MPYRWIATALVMFILFYKKRTNCYQYSAVMLADKGYRLNDCVILSINVPSSIECAQHCLIDQRCESLNYQSTLSNSKSVVCELNNSTKTKNRDKFFQDPRFSYYDLQKQITVTTDFNGISGPDACTTGQCQNNGICSHTESGFYCACPVGFEGHRCEQEATYRSCNELKKKHNITSDGEYKLHLQYPSCNNTVDAYCTDMNSTMPKEYITLKAGEAVNFAKRNYVGSSKENLWASSKTTFAKIRVNPDLSVVRDDFRFASTVWFHHKKVLVQYAHASDCSTYSCTATKKGLFKMDLTGTGLRFVTPIYWRYNGNPNCQGKQPNNYAINNEKQIASGNCGGYCGDCAAIDLKLEIEGC